MHRGHDSNSNIADFKLKYSILKYLTFKEASVSLSN